MTPHQFAIAAGADLKWILNSAALLRRRVRYTRRDSLWWGLVRVLTESLGLPLKAAAEAATASLEAKDGNDPITAGSDPSHSATLVVDLPRYQSVFLGNLSRALVHETPKRRGRPATRGTRSVIGIARRYGVDINLIRAALQRKPAQRLKMLEANAAFLRDMRKR